MLADDLSWPELSSIGRGATRGNQGQKGVLGPADNEGRCILQLRVQPGVLCVKLNRQASEWYRTLDNEVNNALKLTKTYWRKARRRQDYDARADQDHMELHEWLQQLKDKTMSHLELLMQKGDIQGPPYVMSDDLELAFLRKFIERHNQGIPHNPRLRDLVQEGHLLLPEDNIGSVSPESSTIEAVAHLHAKSISDRPGSSHWSPGLSRRGLPSRTASYSVQNREALAQSAHQSMQKLQSARNTLQNAMKESQEAFRRYTACMEAERQARQQVAAAEKYRDDIMYMLLSHSQTPGGSSRQSSASVEDDNSPQTIQNDLAMPQVLHSTSHAPQHEFKRPDDLSGHTGQPPNLASWPDPGETGMYALGPENGFHLPDHTQARSFERHTLIGRKHSRDWGASEHLQGGEPSAEELIGFPPRKRVQMVENYDPLDPSGLGHHDMSLPS